MRETYIIASSDLDDLFPYGYGLDERGEYPKASGRDIYNQWVTLIVDTPLCTGCDAPVDGVCVACTVPLTDVEHLGPGRIAA